MNSDKAKVTQIVFTLLDNACKYTQDGEIRVTLSRETVDNADWVKMVVQDTGKGISPSHLENLFEPFTQADSSHVRDFGGTGLSLALCQRFCKMMNGTIQAESELGHGSTFTVRLPINVAPLEQRV
jgi:signal transduction histidine kinase